MYAKTGILQAITQVLATVGILFARRGRPVGSETKKVLHMLVSELGDGVAGPVRPPYQRARVPRGWFGYGALEEPGAE